MFAPMALRSLLGHAASPLVPSLEPGIAYESVRRLGKLHAHA